MRFAQADKREKNMQVVAVADHFHDGSLRLKGERFEHPGKLHEHIKAAPKAEQADPDEGDGETSKGTTK